MLEYIINLSFVWLIGLIIFDTMLQKESYHTYNRIYLALVIALGIALPLWTWDEDSVIFTTNYTQPIVEQSLDVKYQIADTANTTILGWEQWLWIVYLIGVGVTSILLLKEVLQLISYYRKGYKTKGSEYTLVEVNKPIAPFSIFNAVFIASKTKYTKEEFDIIIAHEMRHRNLLHFVDIFFVRLLSIIFWFHPIIYLFTKRVLMVHEYQADQISNNNPKSYSQFLVEQSSLNTAPIVAHSFIRSPLKKRILMLTKRSKKIAHLKQLILAPVLFTTLLCCTSGAFTDYERVKDGNNIKYRGNTITYSEESEADTVMVEDPVSKELRMLISRKDPVPTLLNGEKIHNDDEHDKVKNGRRVYYPGSLTSQSLKEYLLINMSEELKSLSDGKYNIGIGNVVVNNEGNIVYFEHDGVVKIQQRGGPLFQNIDSNIEKSIKSKIESLVIEIPKHIPARYENQPVHSLLHTASGSFIMKEGKLDAI